MADLNDEQARKLEEGISVLSTILGRAPTESPSLSRRTQQGIYIPFCTVLYSILQKVYVCCNLMLLNFFLRNQSMYSGFIIDDAGSSRQEAGSLPCSRALQALRSVRGRLSGDSRREQWSNFAPYSFKAAAGKKGKGKKVRLQSGSLKMVCLSGTGDCRVPSSIRAKETLLEAGLGEKKVIVPDVSCSKEDFRSTIVSAFPKLEECGGFELLRCVANTKNLDVISTDIAQSPKLLRSIIECGRVFIRPIQKSLDLTPIEVKPSSPEV